MDTKKTYELARRVKANIQQVIVGKDQTIDYILIALLSSGHILLEDVPGTGKTLLAKAVAKSIAGTFKRIQFTPDLLPSDVTGIHYYNQKLDEFQFRAGPVFSTILLADEINRATPRTQSSLLECMEERQVTIDGETKPLAAPFIVFATQNPVENQGTFPLPEAQLDRFLLKIEMGYPSFEEGIQILKRFRNNQPLQELQAVVSREEMVEAQQSLSQVHVSDELYEYMLSIIEKTRNHREVLLGVSPRGSQSLLKAVQGQAILQGRDYVQPDDVKAMLKPVLAHRLVLKNSLAVKEHFAQRVLDDILQSCHVPTEAKFALKGE